MSVDAKLDALQWQILQGPSTSARQWAALAKATQLSSSFPDAVSKAIAVTVVYERAIRALPYSYKLWTLYIEYRKTDTRALCGANEWFQSVRDVYERAVAALPHMPLLWVSYLTFVMDFPLLRATLVRHLVGRSLTSLPVTQHHLIWKPVKRWSATSTVPRRTFRQLWSVYLQLDASTTARRQYFSILQQRQDTAEYVRECARLVATTASLPDPSPADTRLFRDTAFWEPLEEAFREPGWFLEGGSPDSDAGGKETDAKAKAMKDGTDTSLAMLDAMVAYGRRYCVSALDLELAYVGFLYGQGYMEKGRTRLQHMLADAPDAETFGHVFRVAAELEDQLVESFALSDDSRALREADLSAYLDAMQVIFGGSDPCVHVARLARDYPLLANQAQLRSHPRCVPLWLKRAELLQERIYAGLASPDDLAPLLLQAISQCVGGLETVDAAAAQLYHTYATILCGTGKAEEAARVLLQAVWHVPFSSVTANATLLGLWAEIQVLSGEQPTDVAAALLRTLTSEAGVAASSAVLASGVAARRRRGTLLSSLDGDRGVSSPTSLLATDARPWTLAADLSAGNGRSLGDVSSRFCGATCYSAEGAAHMAFYLWTRLGDVAAATRQFEFALTRVRGNSVSRLFLAQQYASFLCLSYSEQPVAAFPLHRIRELIHLAEDELSGALQHAPVAALDVVVSLAFIERWRGLYGNAVRLLQRAAELAVARLNPAANSVLIFSIVEKAIRCTQAFKGCLGTRQFCSALLRRCSHPPLLQRIALHWAAVERRCGNREQAYAVLDACGDSQNPSTPHGAVYWRLWESLCGDVLDFERLVRRRQQVEVRFQKQLPNTTSSLST